MPEQTITIERANKKVEKLLAESMNALPDRVGHKIQYQETSMSCASPGTDNPSGLVRATLDYELTGVNAEELPEYFRSMRRWWSSHEYKILKDTPHNKYLWVEHSPDGFRLALEANDFGEVYLGATSPCVWPSGTPQSDAR